MSHLRAIVGKEINLKYGAEVQLWQDVAAVPPGADWEKTIQQTIGQTTFFSPILTPRFLKSDYCRDEFLAFRRRMLDLSRDDLIFPVHYINVDGMTAGETQFGDDLAFLRRQQWTDFRHLRYADPKSPEVRQWAGAVADAILDAMRRPAPDTKAREAAEKAERAALAKRQAEEERLRREQEEATRRAAEAEERLKAELAKAEAARAEEERRKAERKRREEAERAEAERRAREQAARERFAEVPPPKSRVGVLAALALAAAVLAGGGWYASAPAPVTDALQAEFETAMQTDTVPALEAFLTHHPSGPFTKAATQRRDKLSAAERPATAPRETAVAAPAAPPAIVSGPCGGVKLASVAARSTTPLTEQEECALQAGDQFRECETCQPMVVIPAGSFTMGSPAKEEGRYDDEGPQHVVRIARPFAVGKFSVTVDEFKAFVTATGYDAGSSCYSWTGTEWKTTDGRSWRDPGFRQTGSHPAACLNWNDAQAYVAWLKKKTGKNYRLLSEAEWEYAARGGTTTPFWWGSSISTAQANYDGNYTYTGGKKGEYRAKTVPVDSFAPNSFGLYNVHGNVWQWVEDCYPAKYDGAPADGSAWTTGDCNRRVIRGGSWDVEPGVLRAANRSGVDPDVRGSFTGFRLARTLTP